MYLSLANFQDCIDIHSLVCVHTCTFAARIAIVLPTFQLHAARKHSTLTDKAIWTADSAQIPIPKTAGLTPYSQVMRPTTLTM